MRNTILLSLLAAVACNAEPVDPGPSPGTGSAHILVFPVGGGTPDRDGVWVALDDNRIKVPTAGGDIYVGYLAEGNHVARIDSLDPWCAAEPPSASIAIAEGDTTDSQFLIRCTTLESTVRVITRTTVADLPPGAFSLSVNGVARTIGANDTVLIHSPAWGSVQLRLTGVAAWCATAASEKLVPFSDTDTLTSTFDVACGPAFRQSRLSLRALGDLPNTALALHVGPGPRITLRPGSDTVVTFRMDQGTVMVDSVARGCLAFVGPADTLRAGTVGAPATTTLSVGCGRISWFTGPGPGPRNWIETGLDGRDTVVLGSGYQTGRITDRSRDGQWFVGTESRYVPDSGAFESRIYIESSTGGSVAPFHDWSFRDERTPTFGPDDDHITWTSFEAGFGTRLMTQSREGGTIDTLILPLAPMWTSRWSPSGDRLASEAIEPVDRFTSYVGVMVARPGDAAPIAYRRLQATLRDLAWSPDGGRIALAGYDGGIVVWNPETGGMSVVIPPTPQTYPSGLGWNAAGDMLAFDRGSGDLWIVPADGGTARRAGQMLADRPFWPR